MCVCCVSCCVVCLIRDSCLCTDVCGVFVFMCLMLNMLYKNRCDKLFCAFFVYIGTQLSEKSFLLN